MSSPTHFHRQGSFLLQQEEPYTLAPKGATLATLMRRRSSTSLFTHGRDEEEGGGHSVGSATGAITPSGLATAVAGGSVTPTGASGLDGGYLWRRDHPFFADDEDHRHDERRMSALFNNPQMRSMRLIGKAKRYRWERYWKTEEQLKTMSRPLREYYERNNMLIQQYLYIDRLLNSSLPHDLLNEYNDVQSYSRRGVTVPATISEEPASEPLSGEDRSESIPVPQQRSTASAGTIPGATAASATSVNAADGSIPSGTGVKKVIRTPKAIYRPAETTPLLEHHADDEDEDDEDDDHDHDSNALVKTSRTKNKDSHDNRRGLLDRHHPPYSNGRTSTGAAQSSGQPGPGTSASLGPSPTAAMNTAVDQAGAESPSPKLSDIPLLLDDDDGVDSSAAVVTLAIYINMTANVILLAGKLAVVLSVPSISVLASLVDAVLDFLSTVIVWTTTWLISNQDQYRYPVGRRRLEPLGVLVFSIIMITSFVQVMLQALQHLMSDDHSIIELGIPALLIMLSTIVIKSLCWLWCRLVKNSSVQALAADAATDVIFNAGSIAFPILGFYARIWWLDALGGLLLSMVIIYNWSRTSIEHIKHLSGFSATADQRNILLYLTMRFAKTIKSIQGLQAYHAGDKLNIEVDIVLDANMSLKDSHDLSESLQYVLESVPIVDRAFVHADYADYNLPTHMEQQAA